MKYLDHDTIVRIANSLPPLPQVVLQITEIISNPDYLVRDIVNAVQLDPVVTGQLLRMANSPLYGGGHVSTVHEAVVRLGAGTVRSIAISRSARPTANLDLSAFGETPLSYWRHSVAAFSFAEELASRRIARFGHDFATAALLHDFGKLVLARHLTPDHAEAIRLLSKEIPEVAAEMQILSMNHAEVTAVVLQAWGLPDSLVRIVQHHHNPADYEHPACFGLTLANHLAWQLQDRSAALELESHERQASIDALGLTDAQMEAVLESGTQRFHSAMDVFGADLKVTA
ncbi:MAG: HDOD domain-containing protein [Planctomycetaceae bacterium]